MRIIILDDEPNIVNGLCFLIGKFNIPRCETLPFTDPEEALKELKEKGADLVIVDINMPLMSGLSFIEEASKKDDIPFVILSGYNDFSYAQQAIHLKVKEYLIKPVDETALLKIITDTFEEI
ncbi:MAG: response regulator, partial [Treponema sp.]|nr:response regulator [Treponema sp.]